MKTRKNKYLLGVIWIIGLLTFSCVDNNPDIEELPLPDVAFNYSVVDNVYQLDYYVGATVQFVNNSAISGNATWDFGNGETGTGNIVTHRYKVAGTYTVKLTVAGQSLDRPIYISDIKPIMSINPIDGEICEVQTTYISFNVELPNPEGLSEEYTWIFPEGTLDADGNPLERFEGVDPGEVKFSHVGSQRVRLQVKLGGRLLEEGRKNVQVAYSKEVPTIYYAVKSGNIMALKLAGNAPAGMNINPFDMGVKSGQHPLNILFSNSLYVLDCGRQFTYVNDEDGVLGDGRIFVMSNDGSKVETMLTNTGAAFNDPFYGYIEGSNLYFSDRNTGIARINLDERNKLFSRNEYPYHVQNATTGHYGNGMSYGAMNAGFGKINNVWYWCKTFNGLGIFCFTDNDILRDPIALGAEPSPVSGVMLPNLTPKSFVWDNANGVFYFTLLDVGFEGLYRCTLAELATIQTRAALAPYKLTLANGKTVTPITEAGVGEGAAGEFIGICQLALDEETGCVYFGLRSADADVRSGLMRYNPASGNIEHVIEGVEVYGVAINKENSKLF